MLYTGNTIFKNQPSYTHFNKPFEDTTDALYLQLNEIDPLLTDNNELPTLGCSVIIDPRTKRGIGRAFYNYSQKQPIEIFKTQRRSTLRKNDHLTLLHILRAKKQQNDTDVDILLQASRLNDGYNAEKENFQQFVKNYEQCYKEKIYEPVGRFTLQYRKWYKLKEAQLLKQLTDEKYNTLLALPHVVKANTWEKGKKAEIAHCKLLARTGWVQTWRPGNCQYKKLQHILEDYCVPLASEGELQLQQGLSKNMNLASAAGNCCYLSFEAFLSIMTAGLYVDLPTEMMLTIELNPDTKHKIIRFENPLPARHCAWHAHQLVAEQALQNYSCQFRVCKWLKLEQNKVGTHKWEGYAEINACQYFPKEFKVQTYDEYLSKFRSYHEQNTKTNEALLQFPLTECLNIILSMSLPPALNEQATQFLGNHSVKLEHKPAFGSEVMSLAQLLRTWWQLKLLNLCDLADHAICTRISVKTYDILIEERLQLNELEMKLEQLYHVNMPILISRLGTFLEMLYNVPTGQYLLRYNAKFNDKLVLCAPSKEVNQNTISLHALVKAEPTDLAFMLSTEYLAIADDICNRMHMQYKVMPCLFRPLPGEQKANSKKSKPNKFDVIDDRAAMLQKLKKEAIQKHKLTLRNKRKRKLETRAKRRQLVEAEKAAEQAEQDELKKEMEIYELLNQT